MTRYRKFVVSVGVAEGCAVCVLRTIVHHNPVTSFHSDKANCWHGRKAGAG